MDSVAILLEFKNSGNKNMAFTTDDSKYMLSQHSTYILLLFRLNKLIFKIVPYISSLQTFFKVHVLPVNIR